MNELSEGGGRRPPAGLDEASIAAFRNLPIPLLVYDVETQEILVANPAACELFGYAAEELRSMRIEDLIDPADLPAHRATAADPGPRFRLWRDRRKDGTTIWVEAASAEIPFGDRRARLVVSVDVTERERALAELRASEARLRALVGSIDEVLFEFDRAGTCLGIWTVNEALLVAPREEMLGRTVVELVGEERGRPITEAIARVIDTGRPETIEYDVDLADGTHWALARIAPIAGPEGRPRTASFLARDITSRVRAEQELRRAEERWRTLVEQLPAVVLVERPSPDPREILVEYVSPQIEPLYGYTAEEIRSDPSLFFRTLHPEDRERVIAANARAEETGEPFDETYRVVRRDGRVVWVRSTSRLIRDAEGRPQEWVGVEMDVTAQMEAQEALRLAEERYRLVVENAWDLVVLVAPDERIVYASPRHLEVLGRSPEELVGLSAFAFQDPETAAAGRAAFRRAVERKEPAPGQRFTVRRRDGSTVVLEGAGWRPILDERGEVSLVLGIARDVTDLVRAEQERRELLARLVSAQEEERARIAADIHDDPVQAMVAVAMQLDLLAEECEGSPALARVRRLRDSVGRAVTRLRTLLFELAPPSIEAGLAQAVMELGARDDGLGFALSVEDRSARELPMEARTAAFRIVQEALTNVRKHARARHAWVRIADEDGGVRIVVEDDGVGIPPGGVEVSPGHFGLRSMRERAALFGGRLEVGPRPEGGTRVTAWLPQA
ncbi:Oxygen sensor histidine kinase NreB [bacterium HR12]|nr:Oxygen sensor histidine kinase NreB [bacterium HR12]